MGNALHGAADLVWPPQCVLCGNGGERFLCDACRAQFRLVDSPFCSRCGRPGGSLACPDCGEFSAPGARACDVMREVAIYEGAWRTALHRFKYDGMRCLAGEFTEYLNVWLDEAACSWREVDLVIPVPGRALRAWELGYHHGTLLARGVARHLGVPLVQPLERRPGASQMRLSREERLANAPRLYALRGDTAPLTGMRVLVVDDVVTTGATAHAVAACLKSAGAERVRLLALARNV